MLLMPCVFGVPGFVRINRVWTTKIYTDAYECMYIMQLSSLWMYFGLSLIMNCAHVCLCVVAFWRKVCPPTISIWGDGAYAFYPLCSMTTTTDEEVAEILLLAKPSCRFRNIWSYGYGMRMWIRGLCVCVGFVMVVRGDCGRTSHVQMNAHTHVRFDQYDYIQYTYFMWHVVKLVNTKIIIIKGVQ